MENTQTHSDIARVNRLMEGLLDSPDAITPVTEALESFVPPDYDPPAASREEAEQLADEGTQTLISLRQVREIMDENNIEDPEMRRFLDAAEKALTGIIEWAERGEE